MLKSSKESIKTYYKKLIRIMNDLRNTDFRFDYVHNDYWLSVSILIDFSIDEFIFSCNQSPIENEGEWRRLIQFIQDNGY